MKKTQCDSCKDLLVKQGNLPNPDIQHEERFESKRKAFLSMINRGGLTIPGESVFYLSKIAFEFSSDLFQHDFLKSFLSSNAQAKQIYLVSLRERISFSGDVESLLKKCCKDGHAFEMFYDKICGTIFNMSAKNFVSDINSNIHLQKRSKCSEKTSKCKVKIKKLQSR